MKIKTGKYFEDLIVWINKCLHQRADMYPNYKMVDKDTGKLRQIDILIKLNDGPTNAIGIVEIRDRSRKVGVEYIEQIVSKKNSVDADFAIIVSKTGFYNSALEKATKNNIRTFTFEEALAVNWSKAISKDFMIISKSVKSEKVTIYFLEKATKKIINPCDDFIMQARKEGANSLVFMNNKKQQFKSLNDLFQVLNSQSALRETLPIGHDNSVFRRIFFEINFKDDEKIYFYSKENKFVEANYFCFIGTFWIERKKIKHEIHHYKGGENIYADIISTNLNGQQIDILMENPNDLSVNKNVKIRLNSQ